MKLLYTLTIKDGKQGTLDVITLSPSLQITDTQLQKQRFGGLLQRGPLLPGERVFLLHLRPLLRSVRPREVVNLRSIVAHESEDFIVSRGQRRRLR